jgi:hypothetical protein
VRREILEGLNGDVTEFGPRPRERLGRWPLVPRNDNPVAGPGSSQPRSTYDRAAIGQEPSQDPRYRAAQHSRQIDRHSQRVGVEVLPLAGIRDDEILAQAVSCSIRSYPAVYPMAHPFNSLHRR